jgi:hypothetical protein
MDEPSRILWINHMSIVDIDHKKTGMNRVVHLYINGGIHLYINEHFRKKMGIRKTSH